MGAPGEDFFSRIEAVVLEEAATQHGCHSKLFCKMALLLMVTVSYTVNHTTNKNVIDIYTFQHLQWEHFCNAILVLKALSALVKLACFSFMSSYALNTSEGGLFFQHEKSKQQPLRDTA